MQPLELAGVEVEGFSIGGIETCFNFPRFKVAFDIGRCPPEVVARDTIFFTHGHMDHMGGVAFHCATRALRGMPPPTYVVPPQYEEPLERLFDVWRTIDRSDMPHRTVTLAPGGEYELNRDLFVRPFRTYHTAPAQGYAIWSRRTKLRPEFADLANDEIRRLRVEEARDVTETHETPLVAYCGDTTIDVLDHEAVTRDAALLILECTFLDDRVSVESTRARGHVHLTELRDRAPLLNNDALLLHHFSARYTATEIRNALTPAPHANTVALISYG